MVQEQFINTIFNQKLKTHPSQTYMKKKLVLFTFLIGIVTLMSFSLTDFEKTLIGKWELESAQSPGKAPLKVTHGQWLFEFKSDFTYIENNGGGNKKGIWKITEGNKLELGTQKRFSMEARLREVSSDVLEMTHPAGRKFLFNRIK